MAPRLNPDSYFRRLERRAKAGDREALIGFVRAAARAGNWSPYAHPWAFWSLAEGIRSTSQAVSHEGFATLLDLARRPGADPWEEQPSSYVFLNGFWLGKLGKVSAVRRRDGKETQFYLAAIPFRGTWTCPGCGASSSMLRTREGECRECGHPLPSRRRKVTVGEEAFWGAVRVPGEEAVLVRLTPAPQVFKRAGRIMSSSHSRTIPEHRVVRGHDYVSARIMERYTRTVKRWYGKEKEEVRWRNPDEAFRRAQRRLASDPEDLVAIRSMYVDALRSGDRELAGELMNRVSDMASAPGFPPTISERDAQLMPEEDFQEYSAWWDREWERALARREEADALWLEMSQAYWGENPDVDLRGLERLAASGDREALAKLVRERAKRRMRPGDPEVHLFRVDPRMLEVIVGTDVFDTVALAKTTREVRNHFGPSLGNDMDAGLIANLLLWYRPKSDSPHRFLGPTAVCNESLVLRRYMDEIVGSSAERAILLIANFLLGGRGIRSYYVPIGSRGSRDLAATYVDMGDPSAKTLLFDMVAGDFLLTTYEDWLDENLVLRRRNPDVDLRELERRAVAGDREARIRLLRERLRRGLVTRDGIELAAILGSPEASEVVGFGGPDYVEPDEVHLVVNEWLTDREPSRRRFAADYATAAADSYAYMTTEGEEALGERGVVFLSISHFTSRVSSLLPASPGNEEELRSLSDSLREGIADFEEFCENVFLDAQDYPEEVWSAGYAAEAVYWAAETWLHLLSFLRGNYAAGMVPGHRGGSMLLTSAVVSRADHAYTSALQAAEVIGETSSELNEKILDRLGPVLLGDRG